MPLRSKPAVRAMAAGEVKDIREDEMLGWVVEIAHGGYDALYCNMQEAVGMKVGDHVGIADQMARLISRRALK